MKVLILSCNTGGGHNAAAHALAEEVRHHGDEAEVLDYLSLAGAKVSGSWKFIYRNRKKNSGIVWDGI